MNRKPHSRLDLLVGRRYRRLQVLAEALPVPKIVCPKRSEIVTEPQFRELSQHENSVLRTWISRRRGDGDGIHGERESEDLYGRCVCLG